eukprot:12906551-Prorocentrum_lima.AAC.1
MRSRLSVMGCMAMQICSETCEPCSANVRTAAEVSTWATPFMRHASPSPAPVHATRTFLHVLPLSCVVSW